VLRSNSASVHVLDIFVAINDLFCLRHIFLFPLKMLLIATIPSPAWSCCKCDHFLFSYFALWLQRCTWEKVFPLTLLVSLAWHAALSYLIVQSARVFGLVVGIPPEFNGIVLLAPFSLDLMCCLVLVRRGDLAIALHSVVGRTIIQMCLTLGISRALFSIVFAEATEVMVAGASYSMIVWILAVALLLLVVGYIHICRMIIDQAALNTNTVMLIISIMILIILGGGE